MQQNDRRQRIKAWKNKLAQSEKFAYQWIRNKQSAETTAMTLPSAKVTADINRQLEEVIKVWQRIFQKISKTNPDVDTFKQHFVPFMKSHDMHMIPIAGPGLVKTLTKVKPSSPSLDAWKARITRSVGKVVP